MHKLPLSSFSMLISSIVLVSCLAAEPCLAESQPTSSVPTSSVPTSSVPMSSAPTSSGVTLVPSEHRASSPAFEALSGLQPTDALSADMLKGHITLLNIWYEY